MSKRHIGKLAIIFTLVLQLTVPASTFSSFADGNDINDLVTASQFMQSKTVWWSDLNESGGVISLLSPDAQKVRGINYNANQKETFTVDGFHFIVSSTNAGGQLDFTKVADNIQTSAVIQQVYSNGDAPQILTSSDTEQDNPVIKAVYQGQTTEQPSNSFQNDYSADPSQNKHYPYKTPSKLSLDFSKLVDVFGLEDQVGYKYKVHTNELPVGKFNFIVRVKTAAEASWRNSAIIPFTVERENVCMVRKNGDTANWTKQNTRTWNVVRANPSPLTVEGLFLSGQLDKNKDPQSIKNVKMVIAMPGVSDIKTDAVVGDVYSSSDWRTYTPINTSYSGVNYSRTFSNTTPDSGSCYNFAFKGDMAITPAMMTAASLKRVTDFDTNLIITFTSSTGEEVAKETRKLKIHFDTVSTVVTSNQPYGLFALQDGGREIAKLYEQGYTGSVDSSNGMQLSSSTVQLNLNGYYLLGDTKRSVTSITYYIPGNGSMFSESIPNATSEGFSTLSSSDTVWDKVPLAYQAHKVDNTGANQLANVKFNKTITLDITKLKASLPANQSILPIQDINIQVVVTDDKNVKHNIAYKVYLYKTLANVTSVETAVRVNQFGASGSTDPLEEGTAQEIKEVEFAQTETAYQNGSVLVLSGQITAKGDTNIPRIQLASNLNGNNVRMADISTTQIGDPIRNSAGQIIGKTYSFSTNVTFDFKKIPAGTKTFTLRIPFLNNKTKTYTYKNVSRRIKIIKLGNGTTVNPAYAFETPALNTTIMLPAITPNNETANIKIPVKGIFLDGKYNGLKSVKIYFDKTLEATLTSGFTPLTDDEVSGYGSSFSNKFDTASSMPAPDGTVVRDCLNARFNGEININNNDDNLTVGRHNIVATFTTYDGRVYNIRRVVNVKRFAELHAPTVQASISGTSVVANVYDIDFDLFGSSASTRKVYFIWNSSSTSTANIESTSPAAITFDENSNTARITTSRPDATNKYLHIRAYDLTGRKVDKAFYVK